jgi:hypothetical protein
MINWDEVIQALEPQEGIAITTDPSRWNLDTSGYKEIYEGWKKANFNVAAIKWINYYPGTHYPHEIVSQVAESLELKGVHRSWISRIDPGYMAPHHWDVDDNETEYLKQGSIIRYTIIPKDFASGHFFTLSDKVFYDLAQGITIEWNSHREWHSGVNAGMEPNWLFHILGY